MARTILTRRPRLEQLATAYADAAPESFALPEDLEALTDDELRELETQGVDAFEAIRQGDLDAAALEDLETLAAAIQEVRTVLSGREEAAEAAATRAAELADSLALGDEADEVEAADDEELEVADEAADEIVAEAEAVVEEAAAVEEQVEERQPVAASARRPVDLRAVRARQTRQDQPRDEDSPLSLIASADVPGFAAGSHLNGQGDVARAMLARLSAMRGGSSESQLPFATIRRSFPDELTVRSEDSSDAVKYATDERNLPGGSLVAAGGACAIAEPSWSFCDNLASDEGLVSLPEVFLPRGRAQVYGGFEVQDALGEGGTFTYQNDVDGDYDGNGGEKTCVRIPCPTPEEIALGGRYLCVTGGLMQLRSFPELTDAYLENAVAAFRHNRSQDRIAAMIAASDAVTMPESGGAAGSILNAASLAATHLRSRYRMSPSASIQLWMPSFAREIVRQDLAQRMGVDLISVSDERIASYFTARNIAVTWTSGWQTAGGVDPSNLGTQTAGDILTAWPTEIDFVIAPFGTFVEYVGEDYNLSVGMAPLDSTELRTQDRTALFQEEFSFVHQLCNQSLHVTVEVCPSGATGAPVDLSC